MHRDDSSIEWLKQDSGTERGWFLCVNLEEKRERLEWDQG